MEMQFDQIYYTLLGEAVSPVSGIENAFAPGTECEQYLLEIQEAYHRLCHRLHSPEEDPDVEIILSASMSITDILCRKLFEYVVTRNLQSGTSPK